MTNEFEEPSSSSSSAIECSNRDCHDEAITAIKTTAPRGKGLVTTIYQFAEDAPSTAKPYCGPCGIRLAAGLAALTDGDLTYTVEVSSP